jgi:hypothetical protein
MKSRVIIAQLAVLFVLAAGLLQYCAAVWRPKSPTEYVDNFVGKWVWACRQAAPALAYDRTLTN